MDLSAYLLDQAIAATTPPRETEADARTRADAIAEMLHAYAPGDLLETMMACQCIMMQFVATAALRDASNPHQEPPAQSRARAGAISASRTLHQWITKFENFRKRNELRAAEAAKTPAVAQPSSQPPPAARAPQPDPSQRPAVPGAAPNGQPTTAASALKNPLSAAGPPLRSAASGQGHGGSDVLHPSSRPLAAEAPRAA